MNIEKSSGDPLQTILLVDDSPVNLGVMVEGLESQGYEVLVALDGEEALQRLKIVVPDLILLDVMMPGIDGFEVCRRLQEREETRAIPVIFMTSLDSTGDKMSGFAAGAVDYITKPLQFDEVRARVDVHLRLRALQRELERKNRALQAEIDERKRIELELFRRSEEFRALAENAPAPIFRYAPDGRRIYVNSAVTALHGIPAADLLGRTPVDVQLVPADQAEKLLQTIHRVAASGETIELELMHLTPDGQKYFIDTLCTPEFGPNGEVTSVLSIGHDVTGRHKVENLLRRREEEFRSLAENIPDPIIRYDEAGRRRYLNPAAARMLQAETLELLGKTVGNGAPASPGMMRFYQEKMAEVLASGVAGEFEFTLDRLPGGENVHYHVRFVPEFDAEGKACGVLGIGRDISERRRMEEAVRESRDALREAQRIAHLGSWELDLTSNALSWSDEIFRIFEIDRAQFGASYEAFLAAIHPADREAVNRAYTQSLETRQPYEIEHRLLMADQRVKYVHERCETHYAEDGTALRSLGTVQDITTRKLLEEQLVKREQEFRSLAENSPDTVARYDRDCRRLYVNPAFARLAGKSQDAMLGTTPAQFNATPATEGYERALRQAMETGLEGEYEFTWSSHDGRPITSHIRIMPERDRDWQVSSALAVGRDISAIREAERQIRSLTENIPDVIVRYDRECRRIYANPAFAQANGIPVAAVLGRTPEEYASAFLAPLAATYQARLRHAVESGEPFVAELAWKGSEGEVIHEVRGFPEFAPDGAVASVLTIGRDVSALRRAQAELQRREREFRTLAENSPDIVVRYDRDCRVVYANPCFEVVLGIPLAELRGKRPSEVPGLPEAGFFEQLVRGVLQTGVARQFEHLVKTGAGQPLWGLINVTPERDDSGGVEFVQVVTRDVSSLKWAEAELLRREREFRTLAENSPDIVVRYDRDCRFVYANPKFQKALCHSMAELRGKTPGELPGLLEAPVIEPRIREVLASGVADEFEHRIRASDGKVFWGLVHIIPEFDEEGRVAYAQVLTRDITALKETERYLAESRARLRELAMQRDTEQEEERKRLAWEVHEGMGQNLMALRLNLQFVGDVEEPVIAARLPKMLEMVDATIHQVREVTMALRPRVLDLGLSTALEWLGGEFGTRYGVACEIRYPEGEISLEERGVTLFFRVAEAALSYLQRGGYGEWVTLTLENSGVAWRLQVRGLGSGKEGEDSGKDFELAWVEEQIIAQGGEYTLLAQPGREMLIDAALPVEELERDEEHAGSPCSQG